ncbi:hypothetical protein TKK_0013673 [Trichogramma kaykai]
MLVPDNNDTSFSRQTGNLSPTFVTANNKDNVESPSKRFKNLSKITNPLDHEVQQNEKENEILISNQELNDKHILFKHSVVKYNKTGTQKKLLSSRDRIIYAQVSSVRTAVEKVEKIDVNEHMNALVTLSIESEPDDHNFEQKNTIDDNFDEKCDSYEEWSEDEEEEDLRNEFLPFTEKSTIVKKFTQAELNEVT